MSFQSRDRLTIEPDLFVTPAAAAKSPRPSLRRRLEVTLAVWRERTAARRCLGADGCAQPARCRHFAGCCCL